MLAEEVEAEEPAASTSHHLVRQWSEQHGWCVRGGWEDAISIRVPDITYLALRRLVTMGVLEELSTAASLDGG